MKLVVFGATGPTGREIVSQALEQGHQITAFVRNPQKLTMRHDRLRVLTGSVPDEPRAVGEAVRGQDAVVSALGVGKSFKPNQLISRCVRTIVPEMESQGVRRLIFLSAFGVGGSERDAPLLAKIFFRTLLRGIYADKKAGEDYLAGSRLDWTIVQPVVLTNGPKTLKYRVGERLELHGMPKISRADVAHFILTQLQDTTYLRKRVVISS